MLQKPCTPTSTSASTYLVDVHVLVDVDGFNILRLAHYNICLL